MKKTYIKSGLRSLRSTASRFLAIFAIVALGVGFLSGLLASPTDMRTSAEAYYDATDMYDIKVVSTQGLTEADLSIIKGIEGVEEIVPARDIDVVLTSPNGENLATRMHTLPDAGSGVNAPVLQQGRLPEKAGECLIIQTKSLGTGPAGVGQSLMVSPDNSNLPDNFPTEFKVVGIAKSAVYFSMEAERTNVGSGTISLVAYTPMATVDTDYYTAFYLTVENAKQLDSFSDEYETHLQPVLDGLDAIKDTRADLRYTQIVTDANAELADAKIEYEDGKAEAEEKLADGEKELKDAEKQLKNAKKQLVDGRAELDKNLKDYDTGLVEGRQKLMDGWDEISKGETQAADGKRQLDAAQKTLDEGKVQLEAGKAQLESIRSMEPAMATGAKLLNMLATVLQPDYTPDPNKTEFAQLGDTIDVVNAAIDRVLAGEELPSEIPEEIGEALKKQLAAAKDTLNQLKDGIGQLQQQGVESFDALAVFLDESEAALEASEAELEAGQKTLAEKQQEWSDGIVKLAEGRAALADGEKSLQEGILTADTAFADAEKQLEEGQTKYDEGLAEYEKGLKEFNEKKAEAETELADAEHKIADAEQDIRELEAGEWFVMDRTENTSFASYDSNADKIANIAKVFPVFFFLVAALVALTTMTRMVEEERLQIGTLKALGYSSATIASKYILYALFAGALGSVFGMVVGMRLFPYIIVSAYNIMYDVPEVMTPFHSTYGMISTLAAIGCTLLATFSACRSELKERPAQLMLPKSPPAGKRIFLEHITPLWQRMKFTYKVTARNLFLYKKRFFMTITGIAGCTALMVTGFGVRDSISDIVHLQFDELNKYELIVALKNEETATTADMQAILNDGRIEGYLPAMQDSGKVVPEKNKPADEVVIFVPSTAAALPDYFNFRHRTDSTPVVFDKDSVIISEKLAERQGLKVGDTITLTNGNDKRGQVTITDICENYVQHYVYLSANHYAEAFGERPEFSTLLCKLGAAVQSNEAENLLAADLLECEGVNGSQFTIELAGSFTQTMTSMNGIVWVLIAAAGILAFVVLYNLTNINIAERSKEIATIKVLGFYDGEVSAYIYRETAVLTLLGAGVGLVFGMALHQFVIRTAEIDMVMFGRSIYPLSYVYSALLTIVFSAIVSLFMYHKLKKISMVESMKAPE